MPCLQRRVSLPFKQFGLRKRSVFTNSVCVFEGFLCAKGHCLNVQDHKSSRYRRKAQRALEEGEETRLKGDNTVKGEEAVCWEED